MSEQTLACVNSVHLHMKPLGGLEYVPYTNGKWKLEYFL